MIAAHAANIIAAAGEQKSYLLCLHVRFVGCNLRHPSKGGRGGVKIKFSAASLELQRAAIVCRRYYPLMCTTSVALQLSC